MVSRPRRRREHQGMSTGSIIRERPIRRTCARSRDRARGATIKPALTA